jgi:hypothetical protein
MYSTASRGVVDFGGERLLLTRNSNPSPVSLRTTLLWLAVLVVQLRLGRSDVAALPWALWIAAVLEAVVVAIPATSLILRSRVREAWSPANVVALFGKVLGLALAMNHLDATVALLGNHGLYGASAVLQWTRIWLIGVILPGTVQAVALFWIVVSRTSVWRLHHLGAVAFGAGVTYVLCIIDGSIQPLEQWRVGLGDTWETWVCIVLPIVALLSAGILCIVSLGRSRSTARDAAASLVESQGPCDPGQRG